MNQGTFPKSNSLNLNNNNRTILITGASGFLGTWLADEATSAGFKIIGIDLRAPLRPQIWENFSTSSLETVDFVQLLSSYDLYAVLHLAGGASVPASTKDPYGDFSSLLPGTARLALYLAQVQPHVRLFLFSSAAVYGNASSLPIHETSPILPISPYGVHKATAETLLSHYARILGLKVTIFRIFSVYGPGLRKQLIWDVCLRALSAFKAGQKSITLYGSGMESRDFIYVRDVCQAVLTVMNRKVDTQIEILNLASGIESTIVDVTECLIRHLQIDISIVFNGVVQKGDPVNWRADTTRLSQLEFRCKYNLDDGLKHVALWAKSLNSL